MHFKANERKRRKLSHSYRNEQFELRYSNFRDVRIKTELLKLRSWLDPLVGRFPNFVEFSVDNGVEYVTFRCKGLNSSCTSNAVAGVSSDIINIVL